MKLSEQEREAEEQNGGGGQDWGEALGTWLERVQRE